MQHAAKKFAPSKRTRRVFGYTAVSKYGGHFIDTKNFSAGVWKSWIHKAVLLAIIIVLLSAFAVLSFVSFNTDQSLYSELGFSYRILVCSFIGSMLVGIVALYQWSLLRKKHKHQIDINQHLTFVNAAIQDMNLGLTITDTEGTIRFVNRAQARMVGRRAQDIIGQPAKILGPKQLWKDIEWQAAEEAKRFAHESINIHSNGTQFPVQLTSSVVHTSDGQPLGMVATCEDISDRKAAEAELAAHRHDLSRLAIYLDTVRERERSEVSAVIQHRIGSSLTAVKLNLSMMEINSEDTIGQHLERIHEMNGSLDDAIDLVRQIASQLHSSLLDNVGLFAAIETHIKDFKAQNDIQVEFNRLPIEPTLSLELKRVLYRIYQEAMTNCQKHAKATKISIDFNEQEDRIVLRIRDNGIGIRPERASGESAFGLIAITERAKHIGGAVTVEGKQNEGTTVNAEIPFKSERKKHQSRPWNRVCD